MTILLHETNRGKGAALKTGLAHVRGNAVIIQDADLEYDPSDYPLLLQPIVEDWADVVYGSRFSGGGYGGCVIALVDATQAAAAASTIITNYCEQFPAIADQAAVYLARSADGLRQVGVDERG